MNHLPLTNRRSLRCLLAIALIPTALGCQPKDTTFRVTAFAEDGNGEVFIEQFPDGAFTKNALGNYKLAFKLPPRRMPIRPPEPADVAPDAEPAVEADASAPEIVANQPAGTFEDVPEEVYIAQFVLVDLLWHPEPGTTFVESSQTNAGLTYCLVRGADTVRYEGAGFVYFRLDRDGRTMTGSIESATLYPTEATSNSIDVLGPCRVTADFVARKSPSDVADVQRILVMPDHRSASR